MDLTRVDPSLAVGPQLRPEQLSEVAAAGFRGIINNRPDGEEPGQPRSCELQAEAMRLGLLYRHIPVVPGQMTEADARAFARALREAGGPVVAFCRSGNRSASLWNLARQIGGPG